MSAEAFCAALLRTYKVDAPLQKRIEALLRSMFEGTPVFTNERPHLCKELLHGVEI